MSLPNIVKNIGKTVRDKLGDREELKEKAKDLPLYLVQTALSGIGQVLLLGDRLRNNLKRMTEEKEEETREPAAEAKAAAETAEPDKPVRREPVIFAPRQAPTTEAAEANGGKARPEPVIFAPTKTKAAADKEAAAEEAKVAEEAAKPVAEPEKPAAETKPADTKPAETKPAETKPAVTEPAEAPAAAPAAESGELAKAVKVTEEAEHEEVTPVTAAAESSDAPKSTSLVEPLPGYDALTVASLRARMRGKSAEQIRELLEYEKATHGRETVVKMFQNRLAKLEAEK